MEELKIKSFEDLTNLELYGIMQARQNIFIIEQDCVYPDMDDVDQEAFHVFFKEVESILAYCRIYWDKEEEVVKIGRVITVKRGVGLGLKLMLSAIEVVKREYDSGEILIHAQEYATGFYEKAGFVVYDPVSFLEDGLPHFHMKLEL